MAAAESQHAAYIVIEGPGHEGTRLALREGITSFGRLPANDVILLGDLVSRHHSRITFFEGRATLQDLGSHNGSWVNGEKTTSRVLKDGDIVRVGNFQLSFHQGPVPARLDETTAGEESSNLSTPPLPITDDPSGVGVLIGEIEAARRGAPSPARAIHFLYRTSDALARAPDAHAYAEQMLELALEHAPASGSAWLRLEGHRLRVEVTRGPEGPVPDLEVYLPAVEWALEKRFPVRSDDVRADARFGGRGQKDDPFASVIVVPLETESSRGAIYLRRIDAPFEPAELHRVGVIAHLMREGLRDVEHRQSALAERLLAGLHGPWAAKQLAIESAGGRSSIEGPIPAAVAIVDVHGLAPTADGHPPEDLFDFLSAVHARLAHGAESAGGFAEILNGHRAVLVFGVPGGASEEDTPTLFELVLGLRSSVNQLLRDRPALGPRRLRAGIAFGTVLAGASGGRRRSFSVFGPATATATRLVDAAGAGRVLCDQASLDRAGAGYESRRVGSQPARGHFPAQNVFELLGHAGARSLVDR